MPGKISIQHCWTCSTARRRAYVRAPDSGFIPMGWYCPNCKKFETDLELELKRKQLRLPGLQDLRGPAAATL